jgi:transmembrane sensor
MDTEKSKQIEALLSKYIQGKLTIAETSSFYSLFENSENEEYIKEIMLREISSLDEELSNAEGTYAIIKDDVKQIDFTEGDKINIEKKTRIRRVIAFVSSVAAVFMVAFFLGRSIPQNKNNSAITPDISYNEIRSPLGSKSEIRLPDGTKVILNAGSMIKYQSDFNRSNRKLTLTGEAYFKVANNSELPLIVNVGNINVKAIGTVFNIKAYDDESVIETTLIEGKVEITQTGSNSDEKMFVDLLPNQKATYIKDAERFHLEKLKSNDSVPGKPVIADNKKIVISPKVNVGQVVAWTEGKLIIRGENLENLSIELGRKYDVNILFVDDKIKKYRFTGVLLDETLEQVLKVIKMTAPINYSVEGKTVYLKSDSNKVHDYYEHLKK